MFGQNFYFGTIRKYVALFGTLFNDIHVTRTDKSGNMTQFIKVPITYAPKEKMLARVQQDPDIDRPTAVITLPLMSFEMTNIQYDGNRKLNTIGRSAVTVANDSTKMKYQYNPVPYNIGFRLYVLVKNAEDGTKIIEQILPYFTPEFTATVSLIPEMEITMEIPVVMNTISQEDSYEGGFKERRALIWTLDFTLKGHIYGPVKTGAIIKYANSVFYTPSVADGSLPTAVGNSQPVAYVQGQPGLTANGTPTTNQNNSVPVPQIAANSDYGFAASNTNILTSNGSAVVLE
jgi:hypothetical protein